jgi:hypothetical protein
MRGSAHVGSAHAGSAHVGSPHVVTAHVTTARVAAAALAVATLLAGCGQADGGSRPPSTSATPAAPSPSASTAPPAGPAPSPSATAGSAPEAAAPVDVSGASWAHVHHLAYDGTTLLLGTHVGLYAQPPGRQPQRLGSSTFDVMGLAHDGSRWLASGHPGRGEDLPADLGLRTSPDGRSWTSVSLLGEVDFHRLVASGSTVLGVSAHDQALLRSRDGGRTWARLDNPGVFDLALDPSAPGTVVATTERGPVRSTDGGSSWTPVAGAPLVALTAWDGPTLYAVAPDGTVHASVDGGATWVRRGSAGGQPAALAAEGDTVAVLVGDRVVESRDGGASFAPRLTGIDG